MLPEETHSPLQSEYAEYEPKPQRRYGKRILITIIALLGVGFFYQAAFSEESITYNLARTLQKVEIFSQLKHLVISRDKAIQGEEEGRINILLLGIGGEGHNGPLLTDTIIIGSFDIVKEKVALFSVPRDLWVPLPYTKDSYRKINSIYALAESRATGSGGEALSTTVETVFGTPIHYYGLVDFEGLTAFIGELGGVEVYVERTLEDPQYPVQGREDIEPYEDRFEHLIIPRGWQTMDGQTALKYARSRHALGVEGSDFARARRQQKIVLALKDTILSTETLLKPSRIKALLETFNNNIDTNLEVWEMLRLYTMGKNIPRDRFIQFVFDNGENNFLNDAHVGGAYVLQPKDGDFTDIKEFVDTIFMNAELTSSDEQASLPRIEIQNGTRVTGLAKTNAQVLESYDMEVVKISNARVQTYQKTEIHDLSSGKHAEALTTLAERYYAPITVAAGTFLENNYTPELKSKLRITELSPLQSTDADILIILGQNAPQ